MRDDPADLGESPTLRDVVRIYEIALRSIDRDTKYAETAIATASAALAHGEKLKSSARELVVPSPQPAANSMASAASTYKMVDPYKPAAVSPLPETEQT